MKKKISAETKLSVVLQGMREDTTVAEVCREHGIYASQYYDWKDRLLDSASDVFANTKKKDPEKDQLRKEKRELETTVVELSVELQARKKLKRLD